MSKIVLSFSVAAYYFHTAFMHPNFTVHDAGTSLDWDGDRKVCLFKQHINQRTSFILSRRSCEIGRPPTSDVFNDALNTFYLRLYGVRHMIKDHSDSEKGNSFRLTARVLLYAPSHRQDSTYHGLCYTSRGALA